MASKTAVTEFRRHIRRKNMGAGRKAALRNKGTTPAFAVHTPEADAQAPKAQITPKAPMTGGAPGTSHTPPDRK
jgi:hypothetical protein